MSPESTFFTANLVFNSKGYLWNGATTSIEDIVLATFTDPAEMNSNYASVVAAIQSNSAYPPMFEKAFGTPEVTIDRIAKAIAQYVRTLISADSKFDKYLRGQVQLTPQELNGYVLFTTEEGQKFVNFTINCIANTLLFKF